MSAMLRLLAWVLAVALVALPVVAMVNGWVGGERWPLRTLRVQGELVRVDEAQLRATVLPHARSGFFAVELERIQADVVALPWVDQAAVRKHWPDVLEVKLSEHRPFARWGKDRLLSEKGRLFPAGMDRVPPGLPLLDGPEARVPDVVALYNDARERLANAGGVRGVALDRRGSWSITLGDGTEVVLGRNDPHVRLARFAPLLPRLVAQHPGRRLLRADLRYTNGFALVWAELPKASTPAVPPPRPVRPAGVASWRPSAHGPVVRTRTSPPPASGGGTLTLQGTT